MMHSRVFQTALYLSRCGVGREWQREILSQIGNSSQNQSVRLSRGPHKDLIKLLCTRVDDCSISYVERYFENRI